MVSLVIDQLEFLTVFYDACAGGVSEWPKERASKARVGETQPWVQIPPPPPLITNPLLDKE
jgi:hypothetical protein